MPPIVFVQLEQQLFVHIQQDKLLKHLIIPGEFNHIQQHVQEHIN